MAASLHVFDTRRPAAYATNVHPLPVVEGRGRPKRRSAHRVGQISVQRGDRKLDVETRQHRQIRPAGTELRPNHSLDPISGVIRRVGEDGVECRVGNGGYGGDMGF
jgi:hypothetical protein